jgi:hypothetical protein
MPILEFRYSSIQLTQAASKAKRVHALEGPVLISGRFQMLFNSQIMPAKNSIVFTSPSSSSILGAQPSSFLAIEMSG